MIYLTEDDDAIRELIIYTLRAVGMDAQGFADPRGFLTAMQQAVPECILLDIMLPEIDGITLLRQIRATPEWADIPVMMITAKDTEYDKVIGLDAGADDYLTKPFGMMELPARIRALLRRSGRIFPKKPEENVLSVGSITVNEDRHEIFVGGKLVVCTSKEYEMLVCFMKNPGILFTREQLLNRIWDYSYSGESRTVDVHIRTLRQKLGDEGKRIETVRGFGYKLSDE